MASEKVLNVAFVGGPMYDPLYELLPQFEQQSGYRVNVGFKGNHPSLNAHIAEVYSKGAANYDLISTHTKYDASQRQWLLPLDEYFSQEELAEFIPSTVEHCRMDGKPVRQAQGKLYGIPRNFDVRLVYYRRELLEDEDEQQRFKADFGYELKIPKTWDELKDIAVHFTRPPHLYGFVFPGRYSGLFGEFFERVAMAGGQLFVEERGRIRASCNNDAGRQALGFLRSLYLDLKVCPPELPDMHYDEIVEIFQQGRCMFTTGWPGGYHSFKNPQTCKVHDRFGVFIYPRGPKGTAVYAGGHTFAIPVSVRDLEGAVKLLKFLTSEEAQYWEAKHGSIVCRIRAQQRANAEVPPGTMDYERLQILDKTVREYALIPPKFPQYPQVEDLMWRVLQDCIVGKIEVDEALQKLEDGINEICAQPA